MFVGIQLCCSNLFLILCEIFRPDPIIKSVLPISKIVVTIDSENNVYLWLTESEEIIGTAGMNDTKCTVTQTVCTFYLPCAYDEVCSVFLSGVIGIIWVKYVLCLYHQCLKWDKLFSAAKMDFDLFYFEYLLVYFSSQSEATNLVVFKTTMLTSIVLRPIWIRIS